MLVHPRRRIADEAPLGMGRDELGPGALARFRQAIRPSSHLSPSRRPRPSEMETDATRFVPAQNHRWRPRRETPRPSRGPRAAPGPPRLRRSPIRGRPGDPGGSLPFSGRAPSDPDRATSPPRRRSAPPRGAGAGTAARARAAGRASAGSHRRSAPPGPGARPARAPTRQGRDRSTRCRRAPFGLDSGGGAAGSCRGARQGSRSPRDPSRGRRMPRRR